MQLSCSRSHGHNKYCRSSNVIASSSFSVGCLSVDCAPSFRVQSVVVMVGFAFIIVPSELAGTRTPLKMLKASQGPLAANKVVASLSVLRLQALHHACCDDALRDY